METIELSAASLSTTLLKLNHRLVLAESCTAGLIAASLSRIPGASRWLAGSAVVYQLKTKESWLQIDPDLLEDPGAVSREVSERMAVRVLERTAHATIAASVTGHLGPEAPAELDGTAWSTIAIRSDRNPLIFSRKLSLDECTPTEAADYPTSLRDRRHRTAVRLVLQFCLEVLETNGPSDS